MKLNKIMNEDIAFIYNDKNYKFYLNPIETIKTIKGKRVRVSVFTFYDESNKRALEQVYIPLREISKAKNRVQLIERVITYLDDDIIIEKEEHGFY